MPRSRVQVPPPAFDDTMPKGKTYAIGVITLIPLIYALVVILTPLREAFLTDPTSPSAPDWMLYFVALHFFMFLYVALLLAFYIVHLLGRPMDRTIKIMWILLLIFGSVLTMPLYWFFVFRNSQTT